MDICIRSIQHTTPTYRKGSGLRGGSLDPATAMPGCTARCPILLISVLHTLVLCRIISQELVTQRPGWEVVIFQGWEGQLWRHRRDPRGAFQRWTGQKGRLFSARVKAKPWVLLGTGGAFSSNWTWCAGWCVVHRITSSAETYHGGREKLASVGQEQASFC